MILNPELVCELPVFAASGLVISSGEFYIVSDDEVSLVHGRPGNFKTLSLWDETLPEDPVERKKVKPDFEGLYLSGQNLHLIPSFSKKNRTRGAVIDLSQEMRIHLMDLSELRNRLADRVSDLNIEGALIKEGRLHLFQRGNGKEGKNSVIVFNEDEFQVIDLKLPFHKGVPLTITDASFKDSLFYFTAVAEDTESTYLDGEVLGSFLGTLNDAFEVTSLKQLDFSGKPEGLAFLDETLYFVTDDDSRERPSRLFRLRDY